MPLRGAEHPAIGYHIVTEDTLQIGHHRGQPADRYPIADGSSRTRRALTVEQVEAIASTVDPWWREFALVLAHCGLRAGEAVALRRVHLDDLGRLTIERGMTEHRGRLLERDTKTHKAG